MDTTERERSWNELKSKRFWAAVFGEFIGTAFLVYIVSSTSSFNPCKTPGRGCDHLPITFAYGLGVATLSLWSKGLFNPAIAVAFTSTGKLTLVKGVLFIVMEILGGITGASLAFALTPDGRRSILGDTVLSDDVSTIQGLFIELLLTFILTMAVYAARDPGRYCEGYDVPLSYGLATMACHFVGYNSTSCGINPARSFGPAVVRQITAVGKPQTEWEHHWIYWIGPIGGALLAGVLYHFLYSNLNKKYEVSHGKCHHNESETIL